MDGASSQGSEMPAWRVMADRKGGGITSERRVGAVLFVETARPAVFACLRCGSQQLFRSTSLAVVEDHLLCEECGQLLAKVSQDKLIT
jgi:predicted RNA-binding Zn-ribbon protein involved in translation (DUF1610 family)